MNVFYTGIIMIGIFDSGYGGLSVAKSLRKAFPDASFSYCGDNARAPYGIRSQEVIVNYTREGLVWLIENGATLLVVACNTASAEAVPKLQKEFEVTHPTIRIIGVIDPTVSYIEQMVEKGTSIGLVGTKATIASRVYQTKLQHAGFELISKATPLLVPSIEEGMLDGEVMRTIMQYYFDEFIQKDIKHIILGCTHYYFLRPLLLQLYPDVTFYDASLVMADFVQEEVKKVGNGGMFRVCTTDDPDAFARFCLETLQEVVEVEKIEL